MAEEREPVIGDGEGKVIGEGNTPCVFCAGGAGPYKVKDHLFSGPQDHQTCGNCDHDLYKLHNGVVKSFKANGWNTYVSFDGGEHVTKLDQHQEEEKNDPVVVMILTLGQIQDELNKIEAHKKNGKRRYRGMIDRIQRECRHGTKENKPDGKIPLLCALEETHDMTVDEVRKLVAKLCLSKNNGLDRLFVTNYKTKHGDYTVSPTAGFGKDNPLSGETLEKMGFIKAEKGAVVFHGTSNKFLSEIEDKGLQIGLNKYHVHAFADRGNAEGRKRNGCVVVIINDGWFYYTYASYKKLISPFPIPPEAITKCN